MPGFTCSSCGARFEVADGILARYPGWVPQTCLECRDRQQGREPSRPATRRTGGGAKRPAGNSMTVADVLNRYHDGPQDGVFTDGSAHPNPGEGGWGAVYVVAGEIVNEAHGHEPDTTNNRMELTAVREGCLLVPQGTPATVYTDSRLVSQTFNEWAAGWERRGWKRKSGKVENLDLVKQIYYLLRERPELSLTWIAAHSGYRWNEYADSLSTAYRRTEV